MGYTWSQCHHIERQHCGTQHGHPKTIDPEFLPQEMCLDMGNEGTTHLPPRFDSDIVTLERGLKHSQ